MGGGVVGEWWVSGGFLVVLGVSGWCCVFWVLVSGGLCGLLWVVMGGGGG